MVKLLIYNSKESDAAFLSLQIKTFLRKMKCFFEISTFVEPKELMKKLKKNVYEYDIAILDIDDKESVYIAGFIRQSNLYSSLVFISNTFDKIVSSMIFRPSAYFVNPINENQFISKIAVLYKEQRLKNRYFTIKNHDILERIPYENIDFFESRNRNVYLYIQRGELAYEFTAKMNEIYEALPQNMFYRCHQSIVVNLNNVRSVNKVNKQFVTFSGKTVDISRRNYTEALAAFDEFLKLKGELIR